MKYQETNNNGSFTATGTAFLLEYEAITGCLTVSCARSLQPLHRLSFEGASCEDARSYVRFFEKTAQIMALKYSDNGSVNLEYVFPEAMLLPVIKNIIQISTYALCLHKPDFVSFEHRFLDDHPHIRGFDVQTTRTPGGAIFYACRLSTKKGRIAASRSSTLHAALSYLSDKIVQDILVREFTYNRDGGVHKLMGTAATLLSLSLILNERFEPKNKAKVKTTPIFSKFANFQNYHLKTDS